jgi:WD40 repeat protein
MEGTAFRVWHPRSVDSASATTVVRDPGGGNGETSGLFLSGDGMKAISVTAFNVVSPQLWNTATGRAIRSLPGKGTLFAFSAGSDSVISAQEDHQLRIIPLVAGGSGRMLRGACCEITSLAFSRDGGKVVAGDTAGGVMVWARGRPEMLRLQGHTGGVTTSEFTDDGARVVSTSLDSTVRIWTISPQLLKQRIASYTQVCIPASMRVERLRESDRDAKHGFEACQKRIALGASR